MKGPVTRRSGGTAPEAGATRRFKQIDELSTGLKVFLILALILLPFALITILATAETGRTLVADREDRLGGELERTADRLRRQLVEDQASVATAANNLGRGAMTGDPQFSPDCQAAIERLRARHAGTVRFAIADRSGRVVCSLNWTGRVPDQSAAVLKASVPGNELLLERRTDGGWTTVLVYPAAELARLLRPIGFETRARVGLRTPEGGLTLVDELGSSLRLFGTTEMSIELTGLDLVLSATLPDLPPTQAQVVSVLIPLLMLLGSAFVGWLLVQRLFTRQLGYLTRQVAIYRPGQVIALGDEAASGAREIQALGVALRDLSELVALNTAQVEAGLSRQTALTREVHHRVKNNLQVIASLISLHSRAAEDPVARDAYRSIQRRVDALSVVHRNHFAGTEVSSGVALSALISELAATLGGSSSGEEAGLAVLLDLQPATVNQDTATSVAFLVTELAELAMRASRAPQSLLVGVEAGEVEGTLRIELESAAYRHSTGLREQWEMRYGRVLTGLSRQLRSALHHDGEAGRYAITVPGQLATPGG